MTLLALYAGCLCLGGLLIGASMLGAGKDAHADAPHGDGVHDPHGPLPHAAETDADAHAPTGAVAATLLSLRFWTFALAAFGMTGLLLTLVGTGSVPGLVLAAVTGAGTGAAVTTLLRTLSRDTVSSAVDARALRGRDAEVVLAITPERDGKIRLTHHGQILELLAGTREDRRIERGERVLVVDMVAGRADVTPAAPERRPPSPISTAP